MPSTPTRGHWAAGGLQVFPCISESLKLRGSVEEKLGNGTESLRKQSSFHR